MNDKNLKNLELCFHEEPKTFLEFFVIPYHVDCKAGTVPIMSAPAFAFSRRAKNLKGQKISTTRNCVFTKCRKVYCSTTCNYPLARCQKWVLRLLRFHEQPKSLYTTCCTQTMFCNVFTKRTFC